MPQVQIIKQQQEVTRDRVLALLQWNELHLGEHVLQSGNTYIRTMLGMDDWGITQMESSPAFWAWWRNQWYKRDVKFLMNADMLQLDDRRTMYLLIHDPSQVEFKPQSIIMAGATASKPITDELHRLNDELAATLAIAEAIEAKMTILMERAKK